jgi:putative tryptophan/tyrosine transport system substrate-binding protein
MANRREFLHAGLVCALAPCVAFAQSRPVKVGMLHPAPLARAFYASNILRRLAELGYRQGERLILEYRSTNNLAERYAQHARELVDLKCDVIFAMGPEHSALAVRDLRSSIPIVITAVDYDPVEIGLVASLRKPGGNITGVYAQQLALAPKRLEIMRELLPAAQSFLVFADAFSRRQVEPVRKAAAAAGVRLHLVELTGPPYDFATAFEAGRRAGVEAYVGLASPVFARSRVELAALLVKHRLPGIGSFAPFAEAGFLMAYSADVDKLSRKAAEIAVRILKGTKPADIPVEQADQFEFVVNLKTAKALGLTIPQSLLVRADRVIE